MTTARWDSWNAATGATVLVCAYLLLANLDHSHLWEDEGATAVVGRTLLETGDIMGWDGRNLVGCPQARCLNADGRIVLPPLMFALTAAGIAVVGDNETGYRVAHAVCGLLTVCLLWALVRLKLPDATRLHFLIVAFVALSPQLLMYFRASRYYAFSILAMVASIYAYERWWSRRDGRWLLGLATVTALAFLNHYAIGIAGTLSLALYHLLFRGRETVGADYARVAAAALPVLVVCLGYLWWIGLIGDTRWGMLEYSSGVEHSFPSARVRAAFAVLDLFLSDWISWWILPWFVIFVGCAFWAGRAGPADSWLLGLSMLGLAGIALSVLLDATLVQSPHAVNPRYRVFVLPLLFSMKAAFVDRLWGQSKLLGAAFLLGLLFTNIGSFPWRHGHQPLLHSNLAAFVAEIHRPYVDGLRLVVDFLDANAAQDDIVHIVHAPMMHEPLVASMGNRLRFCCLVPRDGARHVNEVARREWADYVHGGLQPDWIVSSRAMAPEGYAVRALLEGQITSPNPQRPELNSHRFAPPRVQNATRVYGRADGVP